MPLACNIPQQDSNAVGKLATGAAQTAAMLMRVPSCAACVSYAHVTSTCMVQTAQGALQVWHWHATGSWVLHSRSVHGMMLPTASCLLCFITMQRTGFLDEGFGSATGCNQAARCNRQTTVKVGQVLTRHACRWPPTNCIHNHHILLHE